jgi:hypothetical protein
MHDASGIHTLQVGKHATLSVSWTNADGEPVATGPTEWASSNPNACLCSALADNPLSAHLYAPGPVGLVEIQATARQGAARLTQVCEVRVIAGEAVVPGPLLFTAGAGGGRGGKIQGGGGGPLPPEDDKPKYA